jgi:hypothetical protein
MFFEAVMHDQGLDPLLLFHVLGCYFLVGMLLLVLDFFLEVFLVLQFFEHSIEFITDIVAVRLYISFVERVIKIVVLRQVFII